MRRPSLSSRIDKGTDRLQLRERPGMSRPLVLHVQRRSWSWLRSEIKAEVDTAPVPILIAMFQTRHVLPILISRGATLRAGQCECAKSGRAPERPDVIVHGSSFGRP